MSRFGCILHIILLIDVLHVDAVLFSASSTFMCDPESSPTSTTATIPTTSLSVMNAKSSVPPALRRLLHNHAMPMRYKRFMTRPQLREFDRVQNLKAQHWKWHSDLGFPLNFEDIARK